MSNQEVRDFLVNFEHTCVDDTVCTVATSGIFLSLVGKFRGGAPNQHITQYSLFAPPIFEHSNGNLLTVSVHIHGYFHHWPHAE